jgi:hypothetical protein
MIYPDSMGNSAEQVHLHTLERIWIQGKLRMWGRWSYVGGGQPGNMFNQLLVTKKITKTAATEALRRMKKAGISKPELEAFFLDMVTGNQKSHLAHCTDAEALIIDRVICEVLAEHPALVSILRQRYRGKGRSLREVAGILERSHPEWSYITRRRRVDTWLNLAEAMLYTPMCEAFGKKEKYQLKSEPKSA